MEGGVAGAAQSRHNKIYRRKLISKLGILTNSSPSPWFAFDPLWRTFTLDTSLRPSCVSRGWLGQDPIRPELTARPMAAGGCKCGHVRVHNHRDIMCDIMGVVRRAFG